MARRGRFGRSPRPAQNLTQTILAIAREMAAQRQSNLMDAWKNGGTFEGKRVTDDMVLDFWKGEMAQVDPADPLYDQYKNTHEQLDFGINESKQRLLYDQGKLSATAMSQFYLNWAKKIPRDSEFWRTLQTRAAQFIQAEQGRVRSGRASAKKKAYDDGQATAAKSVAPGNLVAEILLNLAKVHGLVDQTDKDLSKMNDPARFQAVLDHINANPDDFSGLSQNGVPLTGSGLFEMLSAVDPNFKYTPAAGRVMKPGEGDTKWGGETVTTSASGGLTTEYIMGAIGGAHAANLALADRARANGKKTDTNKFVKAAGANAEMIREAGLWGISPAYTMIIETRDRIINSPGVSTEEKLDALNDASRALLRLANTPGLDVETMRTLGEESEANAGHPTGNSSSTFGEDYLGTRAPEGVFDTAATESSGSNPGSNIRISTLWDQLNGEVVALATHPEGFTRTMGTRDEETGEFKFDPDGTEIGVVPQVDIQRGAVDFTTVLVEQPNGPPVLVTVVGREVRSRAVNSFGATISPGHTIPGGNADGTDRNIPVDDYLATAYTLPNGDRFYVLPDGTRTIQPPWAEEAEEHDNPNGSITVTMTIPDEATSYIPEVVFIDGVRSVGPTNHSTDFSSSIAASVALSDNPYGLANHVLKDPLARAALQEQQIDVAGVTLDEEGKVIAGDAQRYIDIQESESMALYGAAGITSPWVVARYYEAMQDYHAGIVETLASQARDKKRDENRAIGQAAPSKYSSKASTWAGSRYGVESKPGATSTIQGPSSLTIPTYNQPPTPTSGALGGPRTPATAAYVPPPIPAPAPPPPVGIRPPGSGITPAPAGTLTAGPSSLGATPGSAVANSPRYVTPVPPPERTSGPGYSGTR